VAAAEDPHAYFDQLVRRSDHWKSYSFRDNAMLGNRRFVTYDPASDTDRHRQDAAKVVVEAFYERNPTPRLAQPLSASATVLVLEAATKGGFVRGADIRIDKEVMTVVAWLPENSVTVTRGAFGTAPTTHAAGATIMHASNSLRSQVRVPLETEDGHDYFFVWARYWTDSFMGAGKFNHKAFQFSSGGKDGDTIWLEPHVSYGAGGRCDPGVHVGSFGVRPYNKGGGDPNWSKTNGDMLGPTSNLRDSSRDSFCVEPNTWVRFFFHIKQRANDYDPLDVWVADERREPVHLIVNSPVSVRPSGLTPNSIAKFWIEFNSSEDDLLRVDGRNLVAYVRNFVALRDVKDPRALLVRPVAGVPPVAGPKAPTNLRILR
jgi:hypothetical protein